LCGTVLRLVCPSTFVYLGDEKWTFEHVQDARHGGAWPALGMASSRGVRNAPMSVWVFVVLAAAGRVATPEGLTRAVALLALVAHVGMLAIPARLVEDGTPERGQSPEQERAAWTWAFALTMTNPILVFLERKIWAQSVLPIFDVVLLSTFFLRRTRAGSFVWGLVGAVVGQIHMAGFFFAAPLPVFAKLLGRTPVRWRAWLAGSALGLVPAIPWLLYLVRDRPPPNPSPWWLRFRLEFYEYFFSDPTATCIGYVIGEDTLAALRYPLVAGRPTFLVGAALAMLAIASLAIAARVLRHAWQARHDWRDLLFGDRSDTGILLASTLVGMGALMTLPSISIHRHYMMAVFPLPYVWTARAALRKPGGEKWLSAIFAGGLVVTAGVLSFAVANDGAQEFGKSWGAQVRDGTSTEEAARFRREAR
jgi:hypothetical protein